MHYKMKLIKGDITSLAVDAIVNTANPTLLGGSNQLDELIHLKAGRKLLEACFALKGCKIGMAKITDAYSLPAKHIIHTVGPIWLGGSTDEAQALTNCYQNALKVAVKNQIRSIAFPNISTGCKNFPKNTAATIAMISVNEFLEEHDEFIDEVIFVCYDEENYNYYLDWMANSNGFRQNSSEW